MDERLFFLISSLSLCRKLFIYLDSAVNYLIGFIVFNLNCFQVFILLRQKRF